MRQLRHRKQAGREQYQIQLRHRRPRQEHNNIRDSCDTGEECQAEMRHRGQMSRTEQYQRPLWHRDKKPETEQAQEQMWYREQSSGSKEYRRQLRRGDRCLG
ncbi:hypothetical protein NDU88_001549 [Pleurodeles waltl]|uniref:Uncharacterized protein n=1 Tax=Pleurodeles waltl TaxID=8319 RepID=A0AAV7TKF0_PLEWA|nr:hypothetical protein NDU88_001549 [Pleurodeles waltl]